MNVSLNEASYQVFKNAGKLFYLINPNETTYKNPEEVPDYWKEIWVPFFLLVILEQIILFTKNKKVRWNEQVTSLSHWIFDETVRFLSRGAEYYFYIQLYNKFHLWELAWDSLLTWIIAALSVEFCYYWAHRCNHEITFLWIFHQVHHSSEEFSLVVGLRQSILQTWCNFVSIGAVVLCVVLQTLSIFYLPLTLFVPPSHFISHKQFNLIYQLCLHTTLIGDLKPFDWFLNTAKHHRVHHGCNLYCLDKNYGGVFIIWDRLFGTFQEEKEEIVYGLVVSSSSFNPIYLQLYYLKIVFQKSATMYSWWNKIGTFWKGPSWFPGAPRLGLDRYKIYVTTRHVYDPYVPAWQVLYVLLHFASVIVNHYLVITDSYNSWIEYSPKILNNLLALSGIGLLFNGDNRVALFECIRCIFYLYIMSHNRSVVDTCVYVLHGFSLYCIWMPCLIKLISDYTYEYSLIAHRLKKARVHLSLKTKVLYIIKSIFEREHLKCEMDEFQIAMNNFSNKLNESTDINENSNGLRKLFLNH